MNDAFPDDALAALARALSHPARLAILRVLAARQTCVCGEIVDVMPLAQSTVSQHLKVLREAGLVRGTVDGPRSCYGLAPDALSRAFAAFADLFDALAAPSPCACFPGSCTCCARDEAAPLAPPSSDGIPSTPTATPP